MKSGYSFKTKENMAKASVRNINISPKQAIEICNYIRGRSLVKAKMLLQQSIDMKHPIPMKIYTNGLGHKPGMSAGRFYPKACMEILKALNTAQANAKNKGLNISDLRLTSLVAQKAGKQWHHGRKRRSIFKNVHLEVGVEEIKGLNDKIGKTSEQINKVSNKSVSTKSDNTRGIKSNKILNNNKNNDNKNNEINIPLNNKRDASTEKTAEKESVVFSEDNAQKSMASEEESGDEVLESAKKKQKVKK